MHFYLIRPDGTIRAVAQRELGANETDTTFKSEKYFDPKTHRYDFKTKKIGELTGSQKLKVEKAQKKATAGVDKLRNRDERKLKALMKKLGAKEAEAFRLLSKLLGGPEL